jgi:nicotinate-nucleotide--dimethylbenzimidazole phosphoribosyltransferase
MNQGDGMGILEKTIGAIGPMDRAAADAARRRQDSLTKPRGSLGRLEELSLRLAGITGKAIPTVDKKVIAVMAADHGVTEEGVSLYPQDVTAQMLGNFLAGGAAINVLARQIGARVAVTDVGVRGPVPASPALRAWRIADGTKNIARGPAMTRGEAVRSLEAGISVVEEEMALGLDILGTGDMGIGNTTPSSAIASVITGRTPEKCTGRGTGLDDAGLERKVRIVARAIEVNSPDPTDPIGVLAKVGGLEIGALAGAMLAAAARRIPVVIDGFISGAAALIASGLSPGIADYFIASHLSVERG